MAKKKAASYMTSGEKIAGTILLAVYLVVEVAMGVRPLRAFTTKIRRRLQRG
jgi:hypothetical protein